MILEIAVFNYESAVLAANAGADRLELCDDYAAGGITASAEVLQKVRAHIAIPVFPIIRPRSGDFYYTDAEFNTMKIAVARCRELGYEGVVTGLLTKDQAVDAGRMKELVTLAYPLAVTFHRAFDVCKDPLSALEKIIDCGCKRILTSGQKPVAVEGKACISTLVSKAAGRIIIMPGGGIRAHTLPDLVATGATEFHSASLKGIAEILPDATEIQAMKSLLRQAASAG